MTSVKRTIKSFRILNKDGKILVETDLEYKIIKGEIKDNSIILYIYNDITEVIYPVNTETIIMNFDIINSAFIEWGGL